MSEGVRHSCGVVGVIGDAHAGARVLSGLYAVQHRGEESAGISVWGAGGLRTHRGMGTVARVFTERRVRARLRGSAAIGHVRYSTMGDSDLRNAQPLVGETPWGTVAVAHNGNVTNAPALRQRLAGDGYAFTTSSDSEVVLALLAQPAASLEEAVRATCARLEGAFSLLISAKGVLFAARDLRGFRPLWFGRRGPAQVVASETPGLEAAGGRPDREVAPGTILVLQPGSARAVRFAEARPRHCAFEHVYFARADGRVFGDAVQPVRVAAGRALAREHPVDADGVIPVPDSGIPAALGYAEEHGLPVWQGLVRNVYVGRTFIQPTPAARIRQADMKLSVVADVVEGKRVVVVDDSVVRGITLRGRVAALRAAGAREVHVRVACPPIQHPCHFGVDFGDGSELIAANRSPAEVAAELDVDSIGFLSLPNLLDTLGQPDDHYCQGCWSGDYPVEVPAGFGRRSMEGSLRSQSKSKSKSKSKTGDASAPPLSE